MHDKYLYIYGGHGGRKDNQKSCEHIYKFDCDTYEWDKINPSGVKPLPRDSHSCVKIGNKMYIFGGTYQERNCNELWTFNFEENTWKKID